MAQDFSMRYVLVDGHGNFGSMDGDAAAAHRYTEARLSRLSMEMLTDIDKETVDFAPNYDEQFTEPTVLPARFPNLLVNGSSGIAVGMSTNIPPHNLTDVVNAILHRINHIREGAETPIKELIDIVKAPDYPTGGAILGTQSVRDAYLTGRGKVILRADAIIEPLPGASGREQIRVTAIPYQVNKANLVKKMADLVKEKKIDGITDIRDESNRNGVRIVIELRKDANANVVLNQLYKLSPLQESHGIIMLALVKNEPKILTLAEMIEHYIEHQKEVITRRTQFDLAKAERRAHIVEGLLKALDHIDEIIKIIRSGREDGDVTPKLTERFGFTEIQAKAILEMRLRALMGLARERLEEEFKNLQVLIQELKKILSDGNYLLQVLGEELTRIRDKFGDVRRTQIVHDPGDINIEDLIDEAQSVITLSHLNYIKRIPLDAYRSQGRGGRGVIGAPTREEDCVKDLFVANTHDNILFFTTRGRAFSMRAFEIPEAGRQAKGMPLVNLLNLSGGEDIAAMIPVTKNDWDGFLIMVTRKGLVKRTALNLFSRINKSGLNAITFREDDTLIDVLRSDGERELFLATNEGRGIRFAEKQARAVGRTAMGVRGMKLREGDEIIGATIADGQVLLVSSNGYGKCTLVENCRGQNRGGFGIIVYKPSPKTGKLVGIKAVSENDGLIIINSEGVIIRIRVADISVQGRYASGVKLINMGENTTVVTIAKITDDDNHSDEDNEE
jgi:DNA gyrase subunit A